MDLQTCIKMFFLNWRSFCCIEIVWRSSAWMRDSVHLPLSSAIFNMDPPDQEDKRRNGTKFSTCWESENQTHDLVILRRKFYHCATVKVTTYPVGCMQPGWGKGRRRRRRTGRSFSKWSPSFCCRRRRRRQRRCCRRRRHRRRRQRANNGLRN